MDSLKSSPTVIATCLFSMDDSDIKHEFNDRMIEYLGYSKSRFASDLLNHGLPE